MRHWRPKFVWISRPFEMHCAYANLYSLNTQKSNLFGFIDAKLSPNRYCREGSLDRPFTSSSQVLNSKVSDKVLAIGEELCGLTLLEVADLTEELRKRRGMQQTEMAFVAEDTPGMNIGMNVEGKGEKVESKEAEVVEKSVFNLILEGFDPASKLKAIKEVRALTSLGLKEAKELVEKAPTALKTGVPKEEAEKIIQTMKDIGAKVSME